MIAPVGSVIESVIVLSSRSFELVSLRVPDMVNISAMVGVAFELSAVRVVAVSSATTVILTVAWAGSYHTSFAVSPAKVAAIVYSPLSAIAFSTE